MPLFENRVRGKVETDTDLLVDGKRWEKDKKHTKRNQFAESVKNEV